MAYYIPTFGRFLYICVVNVGKYAIPMDAMGQEPSPWESLGNMAAHGISGCQAEGPGFPSR